MAQDYYDLLGIKKSATPDEIQKAYRQLARKYHPDLNPDDKVAQQKFKEIQQAHDVLGDAEKRKMYDQFGPDFEKVGAGGSPFRGGAAQPGGFSFEDIFGGGGGGGQGGFHFEGDMGDLFRQFGGGGAAGGKRSRAGSAPRRGSDLSANITIPFNTAVLGGEASIGLQRGGKSESIQLKIPPGIESGKKMRLRGQGEPSPNGGPQGDLLVTIHVSPHPFFERVGKNLELRLPVTIGEAALGATIDIPTPEGTVSLKIPPGSSGGRRLRIKGRGVKGSSGEPGDLYVVLQISIPESLGTTDAAREDAKKAIEQVEQLYTGPVRRNIIF